jgi:hypothetical protein
VERELDNSVLKEYLLGELAEPEQAMIEELYFTDDDFFERLSAVENDLIDRYVQNTLTESERREFEKKYLTSPGRRKRVKDSKKVIDLIINYSIAAPLNPPKLSWWRSLLAFFHHKNVSLQFSLAAMLLIMVFGCLWLIRDRAHLGQQVEQTRASLREKEVELLRQSEEHRRAIEQLQGDLHSEQDQRARDEQLLRERQERERQAQATHRKEKPQSAPAPASIATYVFPLVSVRGVQSQKQLVIRQGEKLARLVIYLKNNSYKQYRVSTQRVDEEEVWSQIVLKGQSTSVGERVSFELPTSVLSKKDYVLVVDAVKPDGTLENLDTRSFSVINENVRRK